MMPAPFRQFAGAIATILLATPSLAQQYGQPYQPQPGYQPQPSFQPQPSYQSGPGQYSSPPASGVLSIVGAWSGFSTGPSGTLKQADAYSADGRFVSVAQLSNGFIGRISGFYRTTPVGPNQLRLDLQLQGWLPREICQQMAGGQPQCQPVQIPTNDTVIVTFNSPDDLHGDDQVTPGNFINEQRDNQPALLQAQAPQRWINVIQPSAPVLAGPPPVITPYVTPGRRQPATNIPGLGGNCDDLQQRRICAINNGRLVSSGGCLACVTD